MIVAVLAVGGLIFGSFVNALVYRLHEGKDWVRGRSACPHCGHQLAGKDLVPVLSWLSLGGRCRYCRKPIPDSPVVELAVAFLFVVSYALWPVPLSSGGLVQFICWLAFMVGFVALAVYDMRWLLLPDTIVFFLMALAVSQVVALSLWAGAWADIGYALLGAGLLSGLFLALHVYSKGKWIGFGDVKLAIVLGLLAGDPLRAVLVLFIAAFSGLLVALPAIVRGKVHSTTKLPFGPLLIFGTIMTVLFGSAIINWYLGLLVQ